VSWSQDVAGNAVAVASFGAPAAQLRIASRARVELGARPYPVFDIAASAISFPFRYADDEWVDLGPLSAPPNDPDGRLRAWAQGFVAAFPTDTLSLLKDMNAGTRSAVGYEAREDQGTQTPAETLSRRRGSCRDIATLFIEAARSLGFGARAVSGYLHDPMRTLLGSADTGSTHAWAEVFVPGAGWITFDPTNDRVGAADLIPVAVARDIRLALPVVGGYVGAPDAFESMAVEVSVLAV
jgi:transglutaminase-like putative cysteine protease